MLGYTLEDTIAAISTPLGVGGIGIVRLSGPQAMGIARRLYRDHAGRERRSWQPNRLYYGHVIDPAEGRAVDEVLVSVMRAPHSFTRQDVVEINAHGGPVPLREILRLCLVSGARLAHEGEFTLRAFVNGRIDLAQAEAVLDTIESKSGAALRVAVNQLSGRLSSRVRELGQTLRDVLAYLEASIDFGEDDLPPRDVRPALREVQQGLQQLIAEADSGMVYRQGVRTAIVGRPNVGKSSLLNALLRTDRAIVTPIPGTTRDTLEETLVLQGVPFVLIDTAGINETDNLVEQLGIERSRRSVREADLVLLLVDGSAPVTAHDRSIAGLIGERPALLVVNKDDLPLVEGFADLLPGAPQAHVSAKTGEGIPALEEAMVEAVLGGRLELASTPLTANPRHRAAFERALGQVEAALMAAEQGLYGDLQAIDVRGALVALGEVTGETASEDLLDTIFGQFCVGK
ncbi:MAG: tRNA uridine-5-carboxymethylaminomethyl(34) synthesis GTPase MnmE [Anaerolineales bacterium]